MRLAVDAGARVVAAASSEAKLALARDLGARVTVDHTRPGWTGEVREATGGGAALVYDGAGGPLGTAAVDAVADAGGSSPTERATASPSRTRPRCRRAGFGS